MTAAAPHRTIIRHVANASEVSSAEEVSDEDVAHAPHARDDEDLSESGDDDPLFSTGGKDLDAYLAAEVSSSPSIDSTVHTHIYNATMFTPQRPAWQEKKSSAKGKGKAIERVTAAQAGSRTRGASTPGKYTLPLDGFDNTSGSEFEPEDEEDVEDEDKMSVDVDEEEEGVGGVKSNTASKRKQVKVCARYVFGVVTPPSAELCPPGSHQGAAEAPTTRGE